MNLIDYVLWRGDLPFKKSPFCAVDALVLCQLSYLNFDRLVSSDFKRRVRITELWNLFKSSADFGERSDLGAFISEKTVELLHLAAESERFGKIQACGYVSKIDRASEEQFSALCFFDGASSAFNKEPFVAFRGTDDTIVGWKEDFNLATEDFVPAQRDALEYLNSVAEKTRGKILVGGHSKGGNLAVYSSAFCQNKFKKRIAQVYNFDGPGFRRELISDSRMQEIIPAIHSYYPKFSIVGMLFRHAGSYSVVESDETGVMQHDPFSWHLKARGFETLSDLDKASELFYKTFNEWLEGVSAEKRSLIVETLFKILQAGGATTNSELEKNWLKNSVAILKAMHNLDKETRDEIGLLLQHLFELGAKNLTAKS